MNTAVDVADGVGIGGQWCPSSAVDVDAPGRLAGLEDAGSEEVTTGKLEMSIVTIFVGRKWTSVKKVLLVRLSKQSVRRIRVV